MFSARQVLSRHRGKVKNGQFSDYFLLAAAGGKDC